MKIKEFVNNDIVEDRIDYHYKKRNKEVNEVLGLLKKYNHKLIGKIENEEVFFHSMMFEYMDYISVNAASKKWGISERRIQKLCEENRIDGTLKFGRAWMIPKDAENPIDGRTKRKAGGENGQQNTVG